MPHYYAGIGSRETPTIIRGVLMGFAHFASTRGLVLRSGGAGGADEACDHGARGPKEIYLPWDGFNGHRVDRTSYFTPPDPEWAASIAQQFHPSWVNLSPAVRKLMARNTCQVLGQGPEGPKSSFVICWTPDGGPSGGTGQALRIAKAHRIEVFNLYHRGADEAARMYALGL